MREYIHNLEGSSLECAVAIALGVSFTIQGNRVIAKRPHHPLGLAAGDACAFLSDDRLYQRALMGSRIESRSLHDARRFVAYVNHGSPLPSAHQDEFSHYGRQPEIAALRCLVQSKNPAKDMIELPDDLCLAEAPHSPGM